MKKIGALSNKIYVSSFRPWELHSIQFIDLTDFLKKNINLYFKNTEYLRILAVEDTILTNDWLSDKTRNLMESIYNLRLFKTEIYLNTKLNIFFSNFSYIFLFLKKIQHGFFEYYINKSLKKKNISLMSFSSEYDFVALLSLKNIYLKAINETFILNNFLITRKNTNNYLKFFKNLLNKMLSLSYTLCLYITPQFESWSLNLKLLNIQRKNISLLFGINNNLNFLMKYKNLGLTIFSLYKIFYGKFLFFSFKTSLININTSIRIFSFNIILGYRFLQLCCKIFFYPLYKKIYNFISEQLFLSVLFIGSTFSNIEQLTDGIKICTNIKKIKNYILLGSFENYLLFLNNLKKFSLNFSTSFNFYTSHIINPYIVHKLNTTTKISIEQASFFETKLII